MSFSLEEKERSSILPALKGNKPRKLIQILFFTLVIFLKNMLGGKKGLVSDGIVPSFARNRFRTITNS